MGEGGTTPGCEDVELTGTPGRFCVSSSLRGTGDPQLCTALTEKLPAGRQLLSGARLSELGCCSCLLSLLSEAVTRSN